MNDFLSVLWRAISDLFVKVVLPYLQHFVPLVLIDVVIFMITMAVVFSIGRMLMVTKSDRIKNSLALICILFLNWWVSLSTVKSAETITDMVVHSSIGVLLYVLIGFKLYDRVDDFLDKHFGKDKTRKIKR